MSKIKKGKNKLIVIGKPNGAYNATISMKILNEKRGQIILNIKDKDGKKIEYTNSMIYNKNSKIFSRVSYGTQLTLPSDYINYCRRW